MLVKFRQQPNAVSFYERGRFDSAPMILKTFFRRETGHADIHRWFGGIALRIQLLNFAELASSRFEQHHVNVVMIGAGSGTEFSERATLQAKSDFPAELFQMFGHIFDARIGENLAVDIERGTFALAGFLFNFARKPVIDADVANFKGDGEFIEKSHHGGGPGATALAIKNNFHALQDSTFRDEGGTLLYDSVRLHLESFALSVCRQRDLR